LTIGELPEKGELFSSFAMVKIAVEDTVKMTAAEGDGPVNALDIALREALTGFYPALEHVHLTDYKVRVLDSSSATAAKVRVLISSSDGKDIWTTVGVSTDIVEASLIALIDSIEYKLIKDLEKNMRAFM
jgi:2-isopropylmalate synthase